jgi:hypothetical protein
VNANWHMRLIYQPRSRIARGTTERIVGRQSSMDMDSPLAARCQTGRRGGRRVSYVAGHDFAMYVARHYELRPLTRPRERDIQARTHAVADVQDAEES